MDNNGECYHIFNVCFVQQEADLEDLETYPVEDIFLEILEVYHWFEKKNHLTILSNTWQNQLLFYYSCLLATRRTGAFALGHSSVYCNMCRHLASLYSVDPYSSCTRYCVHPFIVHPTWNSLSIGGGGQV